MNGRDRTRQVERANDPCPVTLVAIVRLAAEARYEYDTALYDPAGQAKYSYCTVPVCAGACTCDTVPAQYEYKHMGAHGHLQARKRPGRLQ